MKKIEEAQKYLREHDLDGWLLYDFHGNNELARSFLEISPRQMTTRRFFYWIPARGAPVKIVHAIESEVLDHFPGEKKIFLSWQSLESAIKETLKGMKKVAMEYCKNNAIPYVSKVDGGTVDLIRSFGIEVESSAYFLPRFTAVLTQDQVKSHLRAAKACDEIMSETWKWVGDQLKKEAPLTEFLIQERILSAFKKRDLVADHAPIVGVNAHAADPHYEPRKEGSSPVKKGDFILIDLWAKENQEKAVYGDICRVAVASSEPTKLQQEVFNIVRKAQKAAFALVKERFSQKQKIEGWEVDEAARKVIREAGYGEFFIHRTGHSIEVSVHGSGAHMDNLEMHDFRPLLPNTCFSLEPGIYLPGKFGVRLESDVLIHADGVVEMTGGEQDAIVTLL